MAVPTLDGENLGNVQSIVVSKNSNLQQIPLPGDDSNEAFIFDMMGVTKSIEVMGNWTGNTTAAVKALVDAIEAINDGDQDTSVIFYSEQTGNIYVKISEIRTTWDVAGIGVRCDYVIKLLEGE